MKVSYLPSRMIQPLLANGKSALFVILNGLKECDFIGGMWGKPLCYGSRTLDIDSRISIRLLRVALLQVNFWTFSIACQSLRLLCRKEELQLCIRANPKVCTTGNLSQLS